MKYRNFTNKLMLMVGVTATAVPHILRARVLSG